MRISELAKLTGHTPETLRYYEKIGLLQPADREAGNNYRSYGPRHVARLDFIKHCRNLDIGLSEIEALLSALDEGNPEAAARAHELIGKHLAEVDARIADLQELRGHLQALAAHCRGEHKAGEVCGIIAELQSPASAATPQGSSANPSAER